MNSPTLVVFLKNFHMTGAQTTQFPSVALKIPGQITTLVETTLLETLMHHNSRAVMVWEMLEAWNPDTTARKKENNVNGKYLFGRTPDKR